jgi:hypothetical protein
MQKQALAALFTVFFALQSAQAAEPAQAAEAAEAAEETPGTLDKYLVDITGGAVSASNLVGMDKSAITQIETSQDLVAAFQPFSSNDQKSGVGFAITPARTSLLPMSARNYKENPLYRLLGSLTFSYARNSEDIGGTAYRKSGYSADTVYYLSENDDPIIIGSRAFTKCTAPDAARNAEVTDEITLSTQLSRKAKDAALEALTAKIAATLPACIDAILKKEAKWNSSRVSVGYGQARIKAPGGDDLVLGKYVTLNGQFRAGEQGALNVSLRRIRSALDTATLGAPAPDRSNSSLAAVRYTYGDVEGTDMRALVEYSNAKSRSASLANNTFLYAVGIDKNLAKGVWLEFRLGRDRVFDSGKKQTTGLLTLSIQPSLTAFKK